MSDFNIEKYHSHNLEPKFESLNDLCNIKKIDWDKTFRINNIYDSYIPPDDYSQFMFNNNRYNYIEVARVTRRPNPDRFWDYTKEYPNIDKLIKEGIEDYTTSSDFVILAVPTICILQNGDLKKLQEATVNRAEKCLAHGCIGEFFVTVEYLFPFFRIDYRLDSEKFPEIFHPKYADKIQYIGSFSENDHAEHFIKTHGFAEELAKKLASQMKEYQETIIILRYLFKGEKIYKEREIYHVKSNGLCRVE